MSIALLTKPEAAFLPLARYFANSPCISSRRQFDSVTPMIEEVLPTCRSGPVSCWLLILVHLDPNCVRRLSSDDCSSFRRRAAWMEKRWGWIMDSTLCVCSFFTRRVFPSDNSRSLRHSHTERLVHDIIQGFFQYRFLKKEKEKVDQILHLPSLLSVPVKPPISMWAISYIRMQSRHFCIQSNLGNIKSHSFTRY